MEILGKRVKNRSSYAESNPPDRPMNYKLKLGAVHHALCLEDKGPPPVTCERYDLANYHRNPTRVNVVDSKVLNEGVQQHVRRPSPDASNNSKLNGLRPERVPEPLNATGPYLFVVQCLFNSRAATAGRFCSTFWGAPMSMIMFVFAGGPGGI